MQKNQQIQNENPIYRLPQTEAYLGLKKTSVYKLVKEGKLKSPIRLGLRASGWLKSDLDEFLEQQILESRGMEK